MTTFQQLKKIAVRAQDDLLQDALGLAALVVVLFVGLNFAAFV